MADKGSKLKNPGNRFGADVQDTRQRQGGEPVGDEGDLND